MIDTIRLSTIALHLSRDSFTDEKTSTRDGSTSVRWVLNQDGVHITYYPASYQLVVEASLIRMGGWRALERFIAGRVGAIPSLLMWRVKRVDYCVDVNVGDQLNAYLDGLRRITLAHHQLSTFASGVVWKSAARWVKFYDKCVQAGAAPGTLRYEVSTHGRGMPALAAAINYSELTLDHVMSSELELYTIMLWLDKLGLLVRESMGEADVLIKLRDLVGVGQAAAALHALRCITTYGTASYTTHGLLSASTYYKYKRVLTQAGLLFEGEQQSIKLKSIAEYIIHKYLGENNKNNLNQRDSKRFIAQGALAPRVFSPKNFSEKILDQLERYTVYAETISRDTTIEGGIR